MVVNLSGRGDKDLDRSAFGASDAARDRMGFVRTCVRLRETDAKCAA